MTIIRMFGLEGLVTLMQLASAEDHRLKTADADAKDDAARRRPADSD